MMSGGSEISLRVLVLVPTGQDSSNAAAVLRQAGMDSLVCVDLMIACQHIMEGAGALLVAEEAFAPAETTCLVNLLAQQAPWSDLPIVLITAGGEGTQASLRTLNIFATAGNITLVERPLRPITLVSSLQVALRARRRQYQMRDLLAEQQLVLESIHEAFVTIDRNWIYTYVSERAAEIAQMPREQMTGKNCWTLYPDANKDFHEGLQVAMRERVPVFVEHRHEVWNKWFESRAFPTPIGISVFTRDITQRKYAEQALRQAKDELEQRVEERTARLKETISELEAFSYSVSHDLRAPLRAMQGYSEFLLEDYSEKMDGVGKDYINRILQASGRLDHLVQDLLTYSRVVRSELEIKNIDLEKLIHEVILSYPVLQSPNVTIEIKRPLSKVRGHDGSLTQCVSNLLTNSIKFVADGMSPHVVIRTESRGDMVHVRFEDNGIGIAPEHQERIFKMFEKAPHRKDYEGTGIGLAIVRKATERMGGKLGVESMPGNGSRFWIDLPKAAHE
jgi:PAS domain S-box-containing protein